MSKTPPYTTADSKKEHKTTQSYMFGFVLSLAFTIIPYHLVVNKTLVGNALLAAILGFAVLQMFVQIFFFLHLGRGPKPLYNVVFFFATIGIILLAVVGSLFIMNNLYHNMEPAEVTKKLAEDEAIYQIGGEKTGACQGTRANHIVTISGSQLSPTYVEAERCDTLTFLNKDDTQRILTFGSYPVAETYAGETELALRTGRGKTITLNQVGAYHFYDALDPTVAGDFRVTEQP